MSSFPILSVLIFLPILASALVLAWPSASKQWYKWIAVGVGIVQIVLATQLWLAFDTATHQYQFQENHHWISFSLGTMGQVSIDYLLGIDGLSMPMVWLTALVMLVGAVSSFEIQTKTKAYFALYLLLNGSVMGCFLGLDFFLFFLFFEFMLLPMYFLIGLWGGQRREYASIKFFIYTLVGSVFILLAMIALYLSVADPVKTAVALGLANNTTEVSNEVVRTVQQYLLNEQLSPQQIVHTFNFVYLADAKNYLPDSLLSTLNLHLIVGIPTRNLAFLLLFIGFAIKLPAIPLHTWLPDAHVEAPTPVSVVLAGILLKIGGYGFIRIAYDCFPDAAIQYATLVAVVGVSSILYGAYNALAQQDLKRLVAYSSVSHMGFVLLGIASLKAEGLNGAIYQLFSHGILSAMLFLVVGVLYSRTHDRQIGSYQGLAHRMPVFTLLTAIAFFASLGLPGFSGFIGELFTLMGGFNAEILPQWIAILGAFGLVLGAGYFLWTFQRMFLRHYWSQGYDELMTDLTLRERLMLVPLAILALIFGIFPQLLLNLTNQTVEAFLKGF